jgi:hypothetical protein
MTTNRFVESVARRIRSRARGVAALGALLLIAAPAVAQFAGNPSLVSVNGAGVQANDDSGGVALSADGTIVAFASGADNLVPLDTNGDTDVFVHDAVTGITTRVSVNWQGKESQGDNGCPSMSADGRYVAFLSRAWNMFQGGDNVATPIWEVYLHDRQGPQTIRVSMPLGGGFAGDHSACPKISADGRRVAFASAAADLVPDDTNGVSDVFVYDVPGGSLDRVSVTDDGAQSDGESGDPAISADGSLVVFSSSARNVTAESPLVPLGTRQVYARDFAVGTTELISQAFAAPFEVPNGTSCCPQISADGQVVLFYSSAQNLIADMRGTRPERLFARDRAAGVTETIDPIWPYLGCDLYPQPYVCDVSDIKGAALSPDGRFVAFLSGSFQLLRENPTFPQNQDQVYLHDRLTRRLRRLSVDATGYPINAYPCGGGSDSLALSAEGRVLAFVSEATAALGLPDANGAATRDVVRLEWTCDPDGGPCRELSVCPDVPATGCAPAQRSRVGIRKDPPLGSSHARFYWRWVGEGEAQSFVDPAEADYHLCVYAGETMSTQLDAGIPSGDAWRRIGNGWQRRERRGALELVTLRSSSFRSMATLVSSADVLDLPYLPLDAPNGITIQLHETTTNRCWEAAFPESAVKMNTRGSVTSGGGTPGIVHAAFH